MCLLWLASWTSGPHGYLGSGRQVYIVTTLHVYRSRAGSSANHSTNCRAFTAARNRTNDGANRGTNRSPGDCLVGLVAFAYRTFIVYPNNVAIRRTNRFENAGEAIAFTISRTNRIEVESHLRAAANSTTTVDGPYRAFNRRTVKLAR